MVVGAGFAGAAVDSFLALRLGRLKVGEHVSRALVTAARRVHRQDTAWGTPGQLVGGTVWVQVAGISRDRRYEAWCLDQTNSKSAPLKSHKGCRTGLSAGEFDAL